MLDVFLVSIATRVTLALKLSKRRLPLAVSVDGSTRQKSSKKSWKPLPRALKKNKKDNFELKSN